MSHFPTLAAYVQQRKPLLGVSAGETGQGSTRGPPSDTDIQTFSALLLPEAISPQFFFFFLDLVSRILCEVLHSRPSSLSLNICICLRKPEHSYWTPPRPQVGTALSPAGKREGTSPGAGGNISGRRNTEVGKDSGDGYGVPGGLLSPVCAKN